MTSRRVLIVDDDDAVLQSCDLILRQLPGMDVALEAESPRAAERLTAESFDLLITDLCMPRMTGSELLERAREADPGLPVLVLTAFPSVRTAVDYMKRGSIDYLEKPFAADDLLASVSGLLERKSLQDENKVLRRQVEHSYCCGNILGKSLAMLKVCERIQRAADTEFDVLIVGETGTGKELVAHALHQRSRRNGAPFVPVNCAAIPDELMESEFFGHERGAFTGAQARSMGLLEYANGGTFFLDELNHLPLRLQGKLLRVLQERKFRRVGSTREIDFDVRIVAASSTSLEEEVRRERFRPDLYHRINVARIELPPLRERAGDIPMLVEHFVKNYATELQRGEVRVSPEALEVLVSYSWPGNVRELQNVIKRALAWGREPLLSLEDLPDEVISHAGEGTAGNSGGFFEARERRLVIFEKEYFSTLLQSWHGDVTNAAREAQLPRGTLYRLLKKHDLNPANFRNGSTS